MHLTDTEGAIVRELRRKRVATMRLLCEQFCVSHMTVVRALSKTWLLLQLQPQCGPLHSPRHAAVRCAWLMVVSQRPLLAFRQPTGDDRAAGEQRLRRNDRSRTPRTTRNQGCESRQPAVSAAANCPNPARTPSGVPGDRSILPTTANPTAANSARTITTADDGRRRNGGDAIAATL